MLFKRRHRQSFRQRVRVWLWPRVSWRRSAAYHAKRVLRLSATPYSIAMGCAVGAFVSCTPFIGMHFLITFLIAWPLRGNLIAGAIGTSIGNPVTFPFIWVGTYKIGHLLLHGHDRDAPARLGQDLLTKSFDQLVPILKPMAIGSVPLGLAIAVVTYFLTYYLVATYQAGRRERFAARRLPPLKHETADDPSAQESLSYGHTSSAPRR
ncbi:DUF2062 domain-containing protein [Propylenella binzhouense]|uniref:DUF2062 domain-containing protein n=1 Tax=Propylenella binzhouense TaxID=2555902 RepID=A0A964T553_9HYPH|nr:DUF2062 domain-containing protein [Propylenella binzhouense]MYZ48706.1 DUF2062 domain-containing protein [Propylenella binzhouense]